MRRALFALLTIAGCADEPPPPDPTCKPGDCTGSGIECGPLRDATGKCTLCGSCVAPLTCGGGGVGGKCGCLTPVCGPQQCGELANRCGAPVVCSFMCGAGDTCGGAGVANACGRRVAHGEACGPSATCGETGDACCNGTCVRGGPGGECPRPGPDIIVVPELLSSTFIIDQRTVTPTECVIADRCLPGPGTYRLLRFATQTKNVGTADLVIGDPREIPGEFEFAACHGHHHYVGYTEYRLLDANGRQVTSGFKAGFCVEDTERDANDPRAPAQKRYYCDPELGGIQGIQVGWSDVYLAHLDCQWVDISRVPPGDYVLEVEVNPPPRRFHEASYDNNIARVPVTVTSP